MKKTIAFLVFAAILAGCTQKGNTTSDSTQLTDSLATDSTAIVMSYDSLIAVEARAAVDSAFATSDEFQQAKARFNDIIDAATDDMTDAQRLIMQLQYAINSLEDHGRHFASNVAEMRNPVNQQRMRIYAEKVKDLYNQLQKLELTPDDKLMLDSLSKKIRF